MSRFSQTVITLGRLPARLLVLAALLLPALLPAPASAGISDWIDKYWLPQNYSKHGGAIDTLFTAIFILTSVVGIGVLVVMVYYCIRYRHRAGVNKAHFTHGNKKLELIWTVIPAVILILLAVWSKASWDDFRTNSSANDPGRAQIMVIGQQFAWSVVYPGKDGKFGRYLLYPKVTDPKWPVQDPTETEDYFADTNVPGPAFLKPENAKKKIDQWIADKNPLGKDFSDPAGADDYWKEAPGRQVFVPKDRPIDVHLSSKDVIHDFFLPDFRVKLDAVPGMRGHVYFTATKTNAEFEGPTKRPYTLEEITEILSDKKTPDNGKPDLRIVIPADQSDKYSVEKEVSKRKGGKTVKEKVTEVVAKNGDAITLSMIESLKTLGIKQVEAYTAKHWDLVCEELCGVGHTLMRGSLVVLEQADYAKRFEGDGDGKPANGQ